MYANELLTCRALASVSPGLAIAAKMAVVVVPIFEPRDNGYALSMLMTPIPLQTNGTQIKMHIFTPIHCLPSLPMSFLFYQEMCYILVSSLAK